MMVNFPFPSLSPFPFCLQQFNQAADNVKNLTKRPEDEELLELYALYKQATVGDNNTGNWQTASLLTSHSP